MNSPIKERPILFSGAMVRAILEGRKTQTRRTIKGIPLEWIELGFEPDYVASPENRLCPYGRPGDRLWVRETFLQGPAREYHYRVGGGTFPWPWKPSIHMPRTASRILLEIVSVRVERLQDISEDDALAEGFLKLPASGRVVLKKGDQHFGNYWMRARSAFEDLWMEINGPDSWQSNPWVWVVEFKRVEGVQ